MNTSHHATPAPHHRLPLVLAGLVAGLAGSVGSLTGCPAPAPTPTPAPPAKTTLFVVNGLGKTIDAIDLAGGTVRKEVMKTGLYPNQLLVQGSTGYLVNSGDAAVVKLDLLASRQTGKLDLPEKSNPMTVTPVGGGKGLVINYKAKTAVFVDLDGMKIEATVNLPEGEPGGGVAVANGKAYVAAVTADYSKYPDISYSFSGIHVIDVASRALTRTITLDKATNPFSVTKDPDGRLQVGCDKGVVTIDPGADQVVRTIAFSKPVGAIDYASAEKAYGAADGNGLVSFNPKTGAVLRDVAAKIVAGDTSVGHFAIRDGVAYVPNFASDTVTVVDLATEKASGSAWAVGDGPQEVAFLTVAQ